MSIFLNSWRSTTHNWTAVAQNKTRNRYSSAGQTPILLDPGVRHMTKDYCEDHGDNEYCRSHDADDTKH